MIRHFWMNRLLCWHGRARRRISFSSNGAELYCDQCRLKWAGIYDTSEGPR